MQKPTQNYPISICQTHAQSSIGQPLRPCFSNPQPNLGDQNLRPAEILQNIRQNPQPKLRMKERTRVKSQIWSHTEIKKIFRLYTEYGSQWKIIQTQFQDRCANSIKNRFYTVVRTLLKLLFKWHPVIREKLPHEIPSKIILKFYEGRLEFVRFKGLGKRILKMIDFNLESKELRRISQQNEEQLLSLYKMIFDKRSFEESKQQIIHPQKCQEFPTDNVYQKNEDNGQIKNQCIEFDQTKVQAYSNLPTSPFSFGNQCQGIVYLVPFTNYYTPITGPYLPLF